MTAWCLNLASGFTSVWQTLTASSVIFRAKICLANFAQLPGYFKLWARPSAVLIHQLPDPWQVQIRNWRRSTNRILWASLKNVLTCNTNWCSCFPESQRCPEIIRQMKRQTRAVFAHAKLLEQDNVQFPRIPVTKSRSHHSQSDKSLPVVLRWQRLHAAGCHTFTGIWTLPDSTTDRWWCCLHRCWHYRTSLNNMDWLGLTVFIVNESRKRMCACCRNKVLYTHKENASFLTHRVSQNLYEPCESYEKFKKFYILCWTVYIPPSLTLTICGNKTPAECVLSS